MKKVIALLLAAFLAFSFLVACNRTEEEILAAEFVEYVRTEAAKQGVSAEYYLEQGYITFEEWKENHAG